MGLTRKSVEAHVIEVLRELCDLKDIVIGVDTNPVVTLGLDSGSGISFALEVEDRLSIKIPDEVNPFLNEENGHKKVRNVGEITEFLFVLCQKSKDGV